jgi:hypothetical protein
VPGVASRGDRYHLHRIELSRNDGVAGLARKLELL